MSSPQRRNSCRVHQTADGRWAAIVRVDDTEIVAYADSREEARARLDELRAESLADQAASQADMTLRDWIDEWLEIQGADLRPTTRRQYRASLAIASEMIGGVKLHDITPLLLTKMFAQIKVNDPHVNSPDVIHKSLKTCLKEAVRLGLLHENPMERVTQPKPVSQIPAAPSLVEVMCPYLRLGGDPAIVAAYAHSNHTCHLVGSERLSIEWQQQFCLAAEHVQCQFYLGSTSHAQVKSGPLPFAPTQPQSNRSLLTAALLVAVILTAVALIWAYSMRQGSGELSDNMQTGTGSGDVIALLPTAPSTETAPPDQSFVPAHAAFGALWTRHDQSPRDEESDDPWVWGPALTSGVQEIWTDATTGERLVQYYIKGRMELNDPEGDPENPWHITSGLLALEMIDGYVQTGLITTDDSPEPARFSIGTDESWSGLPTYAEIATLGLRTFESRIGVGEAHIHTVIGREVETDERLSAYGVVSSLRVHRLGMTRVVAEPFWNYMNALHVIDPEDNVARRDADSPFFVTGYPITDPFWAAVEIGNETIDILWQCFERRCLLYIPSDVEGQVVSGNAGLHYHRWRYGSDPPGIE